MKHTFLIWICCIVLLGTLALPSGLAAQASDPPTVRFVDLAADADGLLTITYLCERPQQGQTITVKCTRADENGQDSGQILYLDEHTADRAGLHTQQLPLQSQESTGKVIVSIGGTDIARPDIAVYDFEQPAQRLYLGVNVNQTVGELKQLLGAESSPAVWDGETELEDSALLTSNYQCTFTLGETPYTRQTIVLGDVDESNTITAVDALIVLKTSIAAHSLEDWQVFAADCDRQQGITAVDALVILQYSINKIPVI